MKVSRLAAGLMLMAPTVPALAHVTGDGGDHFHGAAAESVTWPTLLGLILVVILIGLAGFVLLRRKRRNA